jgi:hypothetical protein
MGGLPFLLPPLLNDFLLSDIIKEPRRLISAQDDDMLSMIGDVERR